VNDPRERIETEHFQCRLDIGDAPDAWEIGGTNFAGESGYADWPEVVAFAEKILAADEAWKDRQTPTLEELRAKYPAWRMNYEEHGEQFSAVVDSADCPGNIPRGTGPCRRQQSDWFNTEGEALRWLAATLAEVTPTETEQQFRECPACDGRGGIARQISEDEWYHSPCEVCEGRGEVPVEELTWILKRNGWRANDERETRRNPQSHRRRVTA
jgi:hypothetical protein